VGFDGRCPGASNDLDVTVGVVLDESADQTLD
jgi:hypothetical protein